MRKSMTAVSLLRLLTSSFILNSAFVSYCYAGHIDANHCLNDSDLLGIAHSVDGDNSDLNDDALVCLDNHTAAGLVDTFTERIIELAITGSHENGHIWGLSHADGTATTIMNGNYTGVDKQFSATSQGNLNALASGAVTVWIDLEADSPELPAAFAFVGFTEWGLSEGLSLAQIATQKTSIFSQIVADHNFLPSATFGAVTFTLIMPAFGNFQTVSYVSAVPLPAAVWMGSLGIFAVILFRKIHVI